MLPRKRTFSAAKEKILNLNTINSKVVNFQYAVRGAQAIRAEQLSQVLFGNVAISQKPFVFAL